MMRCLAVDDESLALDLLEDNIRKIPFLTLVKRGKNAVEAQEVLLREPIDLIFLDIQMPGITGIQFLQAVTTPPLVIFITAYEQFALDGFNLDVVDYLLKPVSFDRFLKAVNKAHELYTHRHTAQVPASADYLFVNADYNLVKVNVRNITYVEGLKDYIKIFVENVQRPIITRMSLKSIEEKLPADGFVRVHKSYIVSLDKIVSIRKGKISIGAVHVPISEHYKDNLYRFIDPKNLA